MLRPPKRGANGKMMRCAKVLTIIIYGIYLILSPFTVRSFAITQSESFTDEEAFQDSSLGDLIDRSFNASAETNAFEEEAIKELPKETETSQTESIIDTGNSVGESMVEKAVIATDDQIIQPFNDDILIDFGTFGTCTWRIYTNNLPGDLEKISLTLSAGMLNDGAASAAYPWHSYRQRITSVTIENNVVAAEESAFLFADMVNLTRIEGLENLDVSNVKNMTRMFSRLESIISLNLTGWNTNKVETMSGLFYGCRASNYIGIEHWDTSNVVAMDQMFYQSYVTQLHLPNWNVSKVKTMAGMFNHASNLTSFLAPDWDTRSLENISLIFGSAQRLTQLAVQNWHTSAVTNMASAFSTTRGLTEINVENWDTRSVTNMSYMFANTTNLTELDLSSWNTQSVTTTSYMFSETGLTEIDFTNWDTRALTNMSYMFSGASKLIGFELISNTWSNTSLNFSYMFQNCSNLTTVNLSGIGGSGTMLTTLNLNSMFRGCAKLSDVSLARFGYIAQASYMFEGCRSLISLDLSAIMTASRTSVLSNASYMFANCSLLETVHMPAFSTVNGANLSYMFANCHGLQAINVRDWGLTRTSNLSNLFAHCKSLIELDLSNWNNPLVTNTTDMFVGMVSLKRLTLGTQVYFPTDPGLPAIDQVGYTGRWIGETTEMIFDSSEIFMSTYSGEYADTYEWEIGTIEITLPVKMIFYSNPNHLTELTSKIYSVQNHSTLPIAVSLNQVNDSADIQGIYQLKLNEKIFIHEGEVTLTQPITLFTVTGETTHDLYFSGIAESVAAEQNPSFEVVFNFAFTN